MLIIGRAVAGIGGAGIINGAISIITAVAPLHRRPSESAFKSMFLYLELANVLTLSEDSVLVGFLMSFSAVGAVTGPIVGGVITEQLSWRWCT